MKVLQLGKFYPISGGVEKVMYELAKGLNDTGIHCDMLCSSANNHYQTISLTGKGNSFIYAVPSLGKAFGTMISPRLIIQLKKMAENYDIIHIHHPDPMAALALFVSGYDGKVIVHWHSDILKQKFLLRFFMPLQNWLLRRADKIIGTTPVYVKESPHLSKFQSKIIYVPIGVMPTICDENKVSEIKRFYDNRIIVFSLGRLVEYKGFEYLISAAKYLSNDYVVLIGGIGVLKRNLQKQIEDLNISGNN